MSCQKVTAIIRSNLLEKVEHKLQEMSVRGLSVTKVKSYGEYANFYSKDWMVNNARIEIFIDEARANAIMEAAHVGVEGDGIVAVLPVDKLYRIRTRSEATVDEV